MKLHFIRQAFRPLFGLERRETATRLLYAFLVSGMAISLVMIFLHFLNRETFSNNNTLYILTAQFLLQGILLLVARRGYVSQASVALVGLVWVAITYQAWIADGVHDVAIYVYIVIIFIAAFLTNWRVSIVLSILSILAIWVFAFMEISGLLPLHFDSPLIIAGERTAVLIVLLLLIYLLDNPLKHSLQAARQGEENFRRIFNVSPVAIAIISLEEGQIIDANPAYWRLTGLDPDLALGKTTIELGHWENYTDRQEFVSKLRELKSIHNPARTFNNALGEERTTLAFYELIEFEGLPAVLTMFYDITEEKKSQAALEASEQKYRIFVEQSMEGIWFLAFDQPISTSLPPEKQVELIYQSGYISECNDFLAHMYGFNSSACVQS